MRLFYDLHIHTCLSPCADDDMTPNNIINMAQIKGLDVIAITDHNHAGNVLPCIEAAKDKDLLVIGGMEVETSENIHSIVLFEDTKKLFELQTIIHASLPPIKNKPDIFGEQYLMDENDEIIAKEERFLVTACGIDIFTLYKAVSRLGGVIFPAHIDKKSYSITASLGSIPPELKFGAVELKFEQNSSGFIDGFETVTNSDSHYLWDISERVHFIEVQSKTVTDVLSKLKQKNIE